MVTNTEPTAVLVLYRLFVTSCVLTLGCSAAADTVECSACAPLDGQCPPGFVVSGDCNCVCGSEGNVLPIDRCDDLSCRAYLRSGYWAGYVRHPAGTNSSRLELYTGKCPSGFCESGSAPLLLPGLSNLSNLTEDLNQVVCGMTRKGLLCGECSPGFGPARGEPLPCSLCALCHRPAESGGLAPLAAAGSSPPAAHAGCLPRLWHQPLSRATELVLVICAVCECELANQLNRTHHN